MGRELRRKQAKKDGKSLEKEEVVEELQLRRFVIIVLVIILVLSALYILSSLFITKELDWLGKKEAENDVSDVSTDDILASDILNQNEEQYYVYFYDFNETESVVTDVVANRLSASKLYRVNTGSVLNANYVGDVGNKKAKKISELKVAPQTLIQVTNGTITEYYEKNEIINLLN